MATSESRGASEVEPDKRDHLERYVDAALPRLPEGSDPVEVAIRDHQRSVERKHHIELHEAICWSLANAPRREAEQRLSQLKVCGIADDDPRCVFQRLLAEGYLESDPRVQLARLRMAGVSEDHPLVKQLSEKSTQSPAFDRREFRDWFTNALKQAHLPWKVIPGSAGANRKWFSGHGPDDGEVATRIVKKAYEISRAEGIPLPRLVDLFVSQNENIRARPAIQQNNKEARNPRRSGADS